MTKTYKAYGAYLAMGLSILGTTAAVGAGDAAFTQVSPMDGITMTIGDTRAVGFFLAKNGACDVTLQLADRFSETGPLTGDSVQVKTSVPSGVSQVVASVGGRDLAVACAPHASTMTIQSLSRVAYATPSSITIRN